MFAEILLTPGGIISWLVVGLLAGWLAGLFMQGSGFGILMDIIVGLVGAFVGGLLFSLVAVGEVGFLGSVLVAFVGACLFVGILRALSPRRAP